MAELRVLIIGGVAGGATAATRLRRLNETARITIFERGPEVSFANCGLPYHISGDIAERERLLLQTPRGLWERYRVSALVGHEVMRLNLGARTVSVRDLSSGREFEEPFDKLILSPGAQPIRPPVPGVEHALSLRTLSDMDAINARVPRSRRAVVIGGGFIGLEMAESLTRRGLQVTVLEAAPQVMAALDPEMASLVQAELERNGVTVYVNDGLAGISAGGDRVLTQSGREIPSDLSILAIGVKPEVSLARDAGLDLGSRGGISVNEAMQTSDPDVYAIGDAAQVRGLLSQEALMPLAGLANRQARVAADHLSGRPSRLKPAQGTAIVKVFDLSVGVTGLNERALRAAGAPFQALHAHPANHAGYYPGAARLSLKLLFDPASGRIWGAQVVGGEGADKRLDVFATAIAAGLSAQELSTLELAYAPPFSSAKDPVNILGYMAENVLDGIPLRQWSDLPGREALLDVRDPAEFELGRLRGAVNIPLSELRDRLHELPDGPICVYCQVGMRGYVATRLLLQHGRQAANLDGGVVTLAAIRPDLMLGNLAFTEGARPSVEDAALAGG